VWCTQLPPLSAPSMHSLESLSRAGVRNMGRAAAEHSLRAAARLSISHDVPGYSSHVAETTSITHGSLFLSSELPQPTEVHAMDSTTRHHPVIVGGIPTSTQSSFSSYLSEVVSVQPMSVAEWRPRGWQDQIPEQGVGGGGGSTGGPKKIWTFLIRK
jgi:hypothetical protein